MSTNAESKTNPFRPSLSPREIGRQTETIVTIILTTLFAVFAAGVLLYLTYYILQRGIRFVNLDLFTKIPMANGEPGGGLAQSIQGSLILVGLAALIGVPLGLFTGIYLSEFGRGFFANAVRFLIDLLTGVPSIIFGLFAWALIVVPSSSYSGFSGAVALSIIMIPIVARTSEDVLRLVPKELREASLALGATESRTIVRVVLPAAANGIITGIVLSMARVAGEAAPLLMTAFGSNFGFTHGVNIFRAMDSLPYRIYFFAKSPFDTEVNLAFAGAFVLILLILVTSFLVRLATGGFKQR